MLRLFAADENFNNDILRGLLLQNPGLDIVRIQDTEQTGKDDLSVLAWCSQEKRILLTHDVQTITKHAYDRVRAGLPMPGVFEVNDQAAPGTVLEDLLLLIECSAETEWEGQICYIPLH